jgi:hypothetical protein
MPTWVTCFNSVVVGRVQRRWNRSSFSWDEELAVNALQTITGPRTSGAGLVYSYAYLNHHVGAARGAFELCAHGGITAEEAVLIDFGCGPATALLALAETHYRLTTQPLRIHYVGIDLPNHPTRGIATDLFDCVRNEGLITDDSTLQFTDLGTQIDWPVASANASIFFALCFVLAHPAYMLPPLLGGRRIQRDPILDVVELIKECRKFYDQPVSLVYTNANWVPHGGVHEAWRRLLAKFDRIDEIRPRQYTYDVFSSDRINGRGNITDWRQRRFLYRSTHASAEAPCDFQVV